MFWFAWLGRRAPALGGTISFSPSLYTRIESILEPFEERQVTPEQLKQLERSVNDVFEDAITGVGLLPGEWRVSLTVDEILGPVPRMRGPNDAELRVAEFEQRLRARLIELPRV